jgi:hypothetical protein
MTANPLLPITRRMVDTLRRSRSSALAAGVFTLLTSGVLLLGSVVLLVSVSLKGKVPEIVPLRTPLAALCAAIALIALLWAVCLLRYGTAGGDLRTSEKVEGALLRHRETWLALSTGLSLVLVLVAAVQAALAAGAPPGPPSAEAPSQPPVRKEKPLEKRPAGPPPRVIPGAEPGEESARLDRECGAPGGTYLCLLPEAGEPVSGGVRHVVDLRTATFLVQPTGSGLEIRVSGSAQEDWSLELAPPKGRRFELALYQGAQRAPFHKELAPGLSVTGRSACNTLEGQFRIWAFDLDGSGKLRRFGADFEQRCDGSPALLVGRIAVERTEEGGHRL